MSQLDITGNGKDRIVIDDPGTRRGVLTESLMD